MLVKSEGTGAIWVDELFVVTASSPSPLALSIMLDDKPEYNAEFNSYDELPEMGKANWLINQHCSAQGVCCGFAIIAVNPSSLPVAACNINFVSRHYVFLCRWRADNRITELFVEWCVTPNSTLLHYMQSFLLSVNFLLNGRVWVRLGFPWLLSENADFQGRLLLIK